MKRSVENILSRLRGKKKLDLFECARVDHEVPLEESIRTLTEFVKEGKFDYIGISECKAETFRRASAVGIASLKMCLEFIIFQVHPIAVVEIEVSPFAYDDNVKDGKFLTTGTFSAANLGCN